MPGPFPYLSGYGSTPAPVCKVTLSWNGKSVTVPALIDSGASATLIPPSVIANLSLKKIGERKMSGVFGGPLLGPIYRVNLDFLGFIFRAYPVAVPTRDRDYALIGRDVLNLYVTTFNGPRTEFSITDNAPQ